MAKKQKKAGKKTSPAKSDQSDEQGPSFQLPPTTLVQRLAKRKISVKKQTSEVSGAFGEEVAKACEKQHLDKPAFAIATRLDGMSEQKLSRTYFHLLRYLDDLNIPARAKAQPDMFENDDEGGGEEPKVAETKAKPGPRLVADNSGGAESVTA